MRDSKEKLSERQTFQFSICLWCGHIQHTEYSDCNKCGAGKFGLGKPRTLWAYVDLKIESIIKMPERLLVEDVMKMYLEDSAWNPKEAKIAKERVESIQSVLNLKDSSTEA